MDPLIRRQERARPTRRPRRRSSRAQRPPVKGAARAAAEPSEEEPFQEFFERSVRRWPLLSAPLIAFFLIRGTGVRAAPVLLIAAATLVLPLSVVRPEVGLYALVLNFMNQWDTYYGLQQYLPISLPIALDLAVGLAIALRFGHPGRLPRLDDAQNFLLVVYVLLVSASVLFSPVSQPDLWERFRTGFLIRPILYFFLILLVRDPRHIHELLLVFMIGHALSMSTAMSEYLQKGGGLYRIRGTLSAINYLAYVCVVTLPILIALMMYFRDWLSRILLASLTLMTLFLSLRTLSRSGFYALLATFGYLLYRFTRRPHTLALAAAFALVFYVFVPEALTERLDEVERITDTGRFYLSRIGLRMSLDHPVLGVGWHAYETYFSQYDYEAIYRKTKAPHSLYFAIAGGSGFPALLAYLGIYGLTGFQLYRLERSYRSVEERRSLSYHLALGLQSAMVGHFVFGLAGSYADTYYAYLVLALGMIVVRYGRDHRELLR